LLQATQPPPPPHQRDDVYHRGQWSMSYLTGYVGINLGPAPIDFQMLPELVRFNLMLTNAHPDRIFKGNFEGVLELDTLPIVDGPGSIVIGASAMLRYNFLTRKQRRLVMYVQFGGGGSYTD